MSKIILKKDSTKYSKTTGELMTLREFLFVISIDDIISQFGIEVDYDKELPDNILGAKIMDIEFPYGEPMGKVSFVPYKINNCFLYEEDEFKEID